MYLLKAKEILRHEYQNNLLKVSLDYQKDFMEEKIRHSYQVLGMGKLLLQKEAYFRQLSLDEQEFFEAVVLLHDVGRFYEIIRKVAGESIDHGVYGAQYLSYIDVFNKPECLLAIYHHGHLIERLYEDIGYLALSEEQKERVRYGCFLVRDADKLANLYLLCRNFKKVENVFFAAYCFENPYHKVITPAVWNCFMKHMSVKRGDVHNFADMALFFLAWVFDLNFTTSFEFLEKMNVVEKLIAHFSKFWLEKDFAVLREEILAYIREKSCSYVI